MKLNAKKVLLVAALTVVSATACTTNLSSGTYSTYGASTMQQVVPGVVVSARSVQVANDNNTVGTVAGAALGGLAGSTIGHGAGSVAGAVGGALLGGLAGNQIEKQVTTQTAMEYVVKLSNGTMVSVVQAPDQIFYKGQKVFVQYGGDRPRVVAR